MPKGTCPECDEIVTLPTDKRSMQCPSCGSKIRSTSTDDEPEEEEEEEEESRKPEKPRKRKKKSARKSGRDSGKIRGLWALIVFGPIGLVLMIMAPFSGYGTGLSMVIGFPLCIGAFVAIYRIYRNEGLMEERIKADADPNLIPGAVFLDSIFCAFSRPHLLAAWAALEYLGLLMMIMGIIGATVFKRLDQPPQANQPGQNQPGGQPGQGGPPKEDEDPIIDKAIANLDSKKDFEVTGALGELERVKPNQRRAEVVRRLHGLIETGTGFTRQKAIDALGVWGGPDDVPTVIRILDDKDGSTRDAALRGLRKLHDTRGLAALIPLLGEWPAVKPAVCDFGTIAEDAILARLDPNSELRWLDQAIEVLRDIGTEKSLPKLEEIARHEDFRRANPAKRAIEAIKNRTKK